MHDKTELRTRAATISDAAAIAEIYNQGIDDRIATFETEPRSAGQIAEWLTPRHIVVVAETGDIGPVAFAASFAYSDPNFSQGSTIAGVIGAGVSTALLGAAVIWAARVNTRAQTLPRTDESDHIPSP